MMTTSGGVLKWPGVRIMVDQTRTKEIEHQDLHGRPKSGKTTGRGAINPLYRRWYKEKRKGEEERVTMFSTSLDLTITHITERNPKNTIYMYVRKSPSP